MSGPSASTRRTIIASLFVHGTLDKASLTGHWSGRGLELFGNDRPLSDDTFDEARRWLVAHELVDWQPADGRRFQMRLGPAWGYAVGVVLGHHSIRCGLGDARAKLVTDARGPLVDGRSVDDTARAPIAHTVATVAEQVRGLIDRAEISPGAVRGITLAVPAPVDRGGLLTSPALMPSLGGDRDLRPWLRRALAAVGLEDLAIDVDNDANVTGVGEWYLRREQGSPDAPLLALKVSGGVGAALVDEHGVLHRGATGAAGELGHVPVPTTWLRSASVGLPGFRPGARCVKCRGRGHLEAYASASAIVDRVFPDPGIVASRAPSEACGGASRRAPRRLRPRRGRRSRCRARPRTQSDFGGRHRRSRGDRHRGPDESGRRHLHGGDRGGPAPGRATAGRATRGGRQPGGLVRGPGRDPKLARESPRTRPGGDQGPAPRGSRAGHVARPAELATVRAAARSERASCSARRARTSDGVGSSRRILRPERRRALAWQTPPLSPRGLKP